MNKILPIILVVVLSSCTHLRPITLPTGEKALMVIADVRFIEHAYTYMSNHCLGTEYTIYHTEELFLLGVPNGYKIVFVCEANKSIPKIYQNE